MEYLIRFAQTHESFRLAEIEALACRAGNLKYDIISYKSDSPFCIIRFHNLPSTSTPTSTSTHSSSSSSSTPHQTVIDEIIRAFEAKAIISRGIYELWGVGTNYDELHADVQTRSVHLWPEFQEMTFKFVIDCYGNTRDMNTQRQLIQSFSYLAFRGKISMKNPEAEFAVMEEWTLPEHVSSTEGEAPSTYEVVSPSGSAPKVKVPPTLKHIYFGRKIGDSQRYLIDKHDLKKRPYISTTSMDAELALVTATLALAAPGKIFLDPFVGTGGFMVAAAELGALVFGSDIDGRSFRGKGQGLEKGVGANFKKYNLTHLFGDCITSDLTNTPLRINQGTKENNKDDRWLDGIVSDPPYGVREGLKVLGLRRPNPQPESDGPDGSLSPCPPPPFVPPIHMIDGVLAYKRPDYIPPKRPYSFDRMLDDILDFAARTLVDGGRIAFWMPSANENELGEEEITAIPTHPLLDLKHECIQRFNKWSRRLLVYQRVPGVVERHDPDGGRVENGYTADELNRFRKRYFQPVKS
ncbi:hypothetical protein PV10_08571 [Exophiala mesophila]|uniref:tRNA (guanine(10)-N(2))-methyltransferase n=1 Tax=Exophiala mesophila TaxID=212818 RepID=A0A0D1WJ79_EXOME|nr:uncharacterized protein PV10_08571 [Exophiala mesophila]KIV88945.1 hypothetical protein PV10_08571 [Exophiala mesophila]